MMPIPSVTGPMPNCFNSFAPAMYRGTWGPGTLVTTVLTAGAIVSAIRKPAAVRAAHPPRRKPGQRPRDELIEVDERARGKGGRHALRLFRCALDDAQALDGIGDI